MLTRRHFLSTTAAIAGVSTFGLGRRAHAADQALIDAAMAEGTVSWYCSLIQDQAARPLAAAFEAKYPGIEVELVSGKVADLLLKINDELATNQLQADVHHGGGTAQMLMEKGEVAQYLPPSAADFPDDMKDAGGHWVAQVVSFLVPAYNTDLVAAEDVPKTYGDLLDPKWQGNIAWATSMTQGGPPGFIGTVLGVMGEDEGKAYLTKLSAQKIVNVPANQRVTLDQVIAGEYPMALCTFSHHSEISKKDGAPIEWVALSPKVTNTIDPTFLMAKAPHPNAGKLFIDFIASEEGQMTLRKAGYIPGNPMYRDPEHSPDAYAISPEMVAEKLDGWIAIYDELFK